MANEISEVNDSSKKPVIVAPKVDMTQRSDVPTSTSTADSAALVKTGVLPDIQLTPEVVAKDAQLLHDAVTHKNAFIFGAPDVVSMEQLLDPTNAKARAAIEDSYAAQYGTKFRDDLSTYVGGDAVNYRTIEAMLNRTDDRTNFGGNLEVALETMKQDPDKGNRLLRAAVGTLDSNMVSQMASDMQKAYGIAPTDLTPANATEQQKKDFALGLDLVTSGRLPATPAETAAFNTYQKAYIDQVIGQASGLSDANRQVLGLMTKGVDQRTSADILQMANVALDAKDLKMFADAVNSDTPAATEARKQLAADQNFVAKYNSTFTDGASSAQQDVAADLLSEGKISLATIIKGDVNVCFGFMDNPENLDLAASNATVKEQNDFTAGKDMALSGRAPATPAEVEALAYYDKINQAMLSVNMDASQRARVEDELQHGGKTLVSRLVDMNKAGLLNTGLFGGYTAQDLIGGIENMSKADYDLLRTEPTYLDDVMKGLSSIHANEDLALRIRQMLQDKADAPTFEASQEVKRTVADVYRDTQYGGATQKDLADAIATMTPADAEMYKTNKDYQAQIDAIVQENHDDSFKYLATSVLAKVAQTGTSPVLDTLQQIAKGNIDGSTPLQQLPLIEKFLQDPTVRARIDSPNATEEDLATRRIIGTAINYGGDLAHLVSTGDLTVNEKQNLGVPFNQLYSDVAKLPEDQRAEWIASNIQDDKQMAVLNAVITQGGEVKLEDKIRAIIVDGDSNESYKDLQTELSQLTTNQEKQDLIEAYENKYKSNLSTDLLPLISDAVDKDKFKGYISLLGDGNQNYFDDKQKTDGALALAADASPLEVDRALQQNQDMLTQWQAANKTLPIEIQQKASELNDNAIVQNQEASVKDAKKIGEAALAVVAVAATIPTFGGSDALLLGDAAATGTDIALSADLATAGTDIVATSATNGIIDGTFTEQLLLAAPTAAETTEVAAAVPAITEAAAVPAITEAAAVPAITEAAAVPAITEADAVPAITEAAAVPAITEAAAVPAITEAAAIPAITEAAAVPAITEAATVPAITEAAAVPAITEAAAVDTVAAVPTLVAPAVAVTAAVTAATLDAVDTKSDAPVANTTDFAPPTVPNDQIIQLATVKIGEGPFMSAERILAAAGGKRPDIKEVKELTAALKKYFSPERDNNKGMDGLKVGYQFITKENFADIIAEVGDPKVQAQLMQFAMAS